MTVGAEGRLIQAVKISEMNTILIFDRVDIKFLSHDIIIIEQDEAQLLTNLPRIF